jgi:large subunit ribosomal protein L4
MPAVSVVDRIGKPVETLELKAEVFSVPVRIPLLHQAVTRELAGRRAGTHETKGRSQVSGGGKKPWRQKGTGRARQGSIRATQWKGGGTVFGPHPRDYSLKMPREARRGALRAALTDVVASGRLKVVNQGGPAAPKTKDLVGWLTGMGVAAAPTLLVVSRVSEALRLASRNVPWLAVETPTHVSVYQLLRNGQVVFERDALLSLQEGLAR